MAITKTVVDSVRDDIKPYIDLNAGNIAPVETTSTAAAEHLAGTQIVFKGKLYNVTQDIAQGGTITVGTNIVAADPVSSDIQTLSNLRAKLGAHNFGLRYIDGTNDVGLTLKNAPDGGTYVNGTATAGGGRTRLKSEPFLLKAGQYVVVGDSSDHTKYSNVVLQNATNGAVIATYEISNGSFVGSGNVFTLAADTMCYFGFNTVNGTAYGTDTFIIYPMVKLADDKDDTFYPYSKPNTELTKDDIGLTANAFENGAVNLLPNNVVSQTVNGITFIVNDDKTITANGTASESTTLTMLLRYGLTGNKKFYKNGRYKLIGAKGGSISTYYMQVACTKSNAFYLLAEQSDIEQEFTVNGDDSSANGAYLGVNIVIMKNTVLNNAVFKPMITVADMPNSDYAHYVPFAKSNKELTKLWNANKYVEQAINWESNVDTYYDRTNIVAHFRVNEFTRHCILDVTDLVTKFTMNAGEVFVLFNVGGSFIPFVNERKDVPILKKDSTYYNGFVTKASSHNGVSFTAKESIPSGTSITFTLDWFY